MDMTYFGIVVLYLQQISELPLHCLVVSDEISHLYID